MATDILRFIADHNRLHRLKQDCFLDMLTAGSMAALAGVDEQGQVEIVQGRWEQVRDLNAAIRWMRDPPETAETAGGHRSPNRR